MSETGINILHFIHKIIKESGKKLRTLSFLLLRKKTSKKLRLEKAEGGMTLEDKEMGRTSIVIFLFHT